MIFAALSPSIYRAHKCWVIILDWNCGFQCRLNQCLCRDKVDLCHEIIAYLYFQALLGHCRNISVMSSMSAFCQVCRDKAYECRDISAVS